MKNQYQKEFRSFQKRMGKHRFWFDALEENKKWDLLFLWKKHKWNMSKVEFSTECSLKKFIYRKMKSPKYRISTQKLRELKLNQIISEL